MFSGIIAAANPHLHDDIALQLWNARAKSEGVQFLVGC